MNLTIPIRAQNSTTSWSRDSRGNFPGKHTWRYARGEHKRYIFSLITVGLLVSTLVVGSVGSMVQMASARDNYGWRGQSNRQNNNDRGGSSNSSRNSNTNTPAPTTTTKTTPAKTTTVAPTTTQPPATPAPAPAVATPAPNQVVTPQIVAQPAPAPAPVDTAPEVASTAAAQATTDNKPQPVTYTSQRLSDETRNRIIIMAVVAATTGALLYTMSLFGAAATEPKRVIPIRYTIPVREVTSY